MEALLFHPKNKEQFIALKAFAKAMKMDFEMVSADQPYNPEFVKRILNADKSAKKGNVTRIEDAKNIWADML